jgi:hypothetical protein
MMLTILGSPVSGPAFGCRAQSAAELHPDRRTQQITTRCLHVLEAMAE